MGNDKVLQVSWGLYMRRARQLCSNASFNRSSWGEAIPESREMSTDMVLQVSWGISVRRARQICNNASLNRSGWVKPYLRAGR